MLSNNSEETLELALNLKNSFNKENIGNAFNLELSNILSKINSDYEYYQWGQDRIHFIEKEIISILNLNHP